MQRPALQVACTVPHNAQTIAELAAMRHNVQQGAEPLGASAASDARVHAEYGAAAGLRPVLPEKQKLERSTLVCGAQVGSRPGKPCLTLSAAHCSRTAKHNDYLGPRSAVWVLALSRELAPCVRFHSALLLFDSRRSVGPAETMNTPKN